MTVTTPPQHADDYQQIHDGIIRLVDTAHTKAVRSMNALMTATIGKSAGELSSLNKVAKHERLRVFNSLSGYPQI